MAEPADGSSSSPPTLAWEGQSPVGSLPNRNGFSLSSEIEPVDEEFMDNTPSNIAGKRVGLPFSSNMSNSCKTLVGFLSDARAESVAISESVETPGGFLSSEHMETLGNQSVEPMCSDIVGPLLSSNVGIAYADSLLASLAYPNGSLMDEDQSLASADVETPLTSLAYPNGSLMDEDQSLASAHVETLDYDSVVYLASGGPGSLLSSLNESDEQFLGSVAIGPPPRETLNCENPVDDNGEKSYSFMQVEPKGCPLSPPGLTHYDEREFDDHEEVFNLEYDGRTYAYGNGYNHQREGYLFNPSSCLYTCPIHGQYRYRCKPWCRWQTDWDRWDFERTERKAGEGEPPGFSFHMQETGPTGVGAGLSNLGNTCFINAILQCFTHTVSLVKALRSSNHTGPCGAEGFCILCSLREHIELSLASSGKVVSPVKLFDNLDYISSSFQRYHQEDAHEFLQCLLNRLERCCLDSCPTGEMSSEEVNIVKRVFGGRLISKLRCCNCGHFSNKYEALIDLSLEIEHVDTLQCALESFTKVEKMEDPESKPRCEKCNETASREKQLMLDQAPSVAIMHLKRFKTDGLSIEKIGKHVEFPLELDLEPYTFYGEESNIDLKYQLYAIVVHNGFLPTSGHYFCYIRSSLDTWHKLDDSVVINFKEDFVLSQAAYILFYTREDTPWFSSLIDSQKLSSNLSVPNASPKSVLETMDGECASEISAATIENGKGVVTEDAADGTSTILSFGKMLERKDNETVDEVVGASEQIYHGTSKSELSLYCDTSRDDDNPTIAVSEPHGLGECYEAISDNEKLSALPSVEVNCNQASDRIMGNDLHPPTPTQSLHPSAGGSPGGRYQFPRSHLRVENRISCKRHSARMGKHLERDEAERCLTRMPGSRGRNLMNAMLPQNDKKQRLRSSPCKRSSTSGSCCKSFCHVAVFH